MPPVRRCSVFTPWLLCVFVAAIDRTSCSAVFCAVIIPAIIHAIVPLLFDLLFQRHELDLGGADFVSLFASFIGALLVLEFLCFIMFEFQ